MKRFLKTLLALFIVFCSVTPLQNHHVSHAAQSKSTYRYIDKKIVLKYKTIKKQDPNLPVGKTRVRVNGKNGYTIKVYRQTIKNGKITATTYIKTRKTVQPINKIILVGTKKAVITKPKTVTSSVYSYGIDPKYRDGRYDANTLDANHGYAPGQKTYNGDKVINLEMVTKGNLMYMSRESDYAKYQKASDKRLENKVLVDRRGKRFILNLSANQRAINGFNNNEFFNMRKFNDELIRLINIERRAKGIQPIAYRSFLQEGANVRANELAGYGSIFVNGKAHVRLNGAGYKTAFSPSIQSKVNGENTLLNVYFGNPYSIVSEKYIAKQCFEQWKGSAGHYRNMMYPYYKGIATSVKLGRGDGTFSIYVANQNFSFE